MYTYGLGVMETLLERHQAYELCVVTRFDPIIKATEHMAEKLSILDLSREANGLVESTTGLNQASEVKRVQVACSLESVNGISYSIKAGILAPVIQEEPDYYLFMVSDQPCITVDTVERLIQETVSANAIGGCVAWKDSLGNPVIFSKRLKEELLDLQGDKGGKSILKKYEEQICKVQASSEIELEDKDVRE